MSNPPSAPWKYQCPLCSFYITVSARGQRGSDQGSGYEAAMLMREHQEQLHGASPRSTEPSE